MRIDQHLLEPFLLKGIIKAQIHHAQILVKLISSEVCSTSNGKGVGMSL
jgi:hypothetical protein